jgi:signal transduction histidine kinase
MTVTEVSPVRSWRDRLPRLPAEPRARPLVLGPALVAYVGAITLAAAAIAAVSVRAPDDLATLIAGAALTLLLSLGSITALSGLDTHWSASGLLHLGVSLVLGPVGALAAAVCDATGGQVRFRSGWFRFVFNVSVFFLSDVAAWWCFHSISASGDTVGTGIVGGLVAGAAQYTVNLCLLTGVIRITSRSLRLGAYLSQSARVAPYFAGYGIAADGAVLLQRAAGAAGFVLITIPVLLLQGFLLYLATRINEQERQRVAHSREREALLQQALDASDQERRRIARDLHDTVVQDLAVIVQGLYGQSGRLRRGDGAAAAVAESLDRAAESTGEAMVELRSMLRQIAPTDAAARGLVAAVDDALAPLREASLAVEVDITEEPLSARTCEAVFRIIQEAARNVLSHAEAQKVTVRVEVDGVVRVEIRDDGRGSSPAEREHRRQEGHLGLGLLGDLAREMGGSLELESEPGGGTVITATFPVDPA